MCCVVSHGQVENLRHESQKFHDHVVGDEQPLPSQPNAVTEIVNVSDRDLPSDLGTGELIQVKTRQVPKAIAPHAVELPQAQHERFASTMFRR